MSKEELTLDTMCKSLRYILNAENFGDPIREAIAYSAGRIDGVRSVTDDRCDEEYGLFIEICEEIDNR